MQTVISNAASNGTATPRLEYIDIAKGIGIFLVVLGHCTGGDRVSISGVNDYIYTFHIPLFFFLSGMCFNDAKYPAFLPFLKRRVQTLFLPLLYFTIIGIITGSVMCGSAEFLMERWNGGRFPPGTLWFIYVLFLTELLYWLINRTARRTPYKVIVLIACFVFGVLLDRKGVWLPFSHCTVFAATFFYGIGHLCRGHIAARIARLPAITGLILVIPLLSVLYGNASMDMYSNSIPSPAVWTCIIAFIGTAGVLIVSNILTKANRKTKNVIIYIGKNTLAILWLHVYILDFCDLLVKPHMSSPYAYLAVELVIISASLFVCIELINRFAPWLVGKNKR